MRWFWTAGLCVLFALLAGCGSLEDDDPTVHLRGVNLVSDSPTIKLYLEDTAVAAMSYTSGSAFAAAAAGDHTASFKVVHPANLNDDDEDDAEETAIGTAFSQSFTEGHDYTFFTYGTLANPQFYVMDATDLRDTPDDNIFIYQIGNVAPNTQSVDVYITAPLAGIDSAQFVGTVAPSQFTQPFSLTVEQDPDEDDEDATRTFTMNFELRVSGTNELIYTSPDITGAEQSRVVFAVAENIAAGPSPVKLMALSSASSVTLFSDPDDNASLRFVHAANVPALDVFVGSVQQPLAQNVAFGQTSPALIIGTGELGLIGRNAGVTSPFAFIEEFSASIAQAYSAYAIGIETDVDAFVFLDDPRSVPTQTSFRFIAAAPSLEEEAVDIYLLPAGGALKFPDDDSSTTDDTPPQFSAVGYRTNTNYATLAGGAYDVYFVAADTERILLGPTRIDPVNGTNLSYALTDNASAQLELVSFSDTL